MKRWLCIKGDPWFQTEVEEDISNRFKMLDISNRFKMLDISNRFKMWDFKYILNVDLWLHSCTASNPPSGKKTKLSKNGYFEGQKQASLAGLRLVPESYLYCIVNKVVGSQPKVWKGGTRQIKLDMIYRRLFKDGLTSIFPHSAFRMGISQACKVFSFPCGSFSAFKAHLSRFRACFIFEYVVSQFQMYF